MRPKAVEAMNQSIISRFNSISEKAKIPSTERYVHPAWGLGFKKNNVTGSVNDLGYVERNGIRINIIEGVINRGRKPFYMTWNRALTKIDAMLKSVEENLGNKQVVTKSVVNIHGFPN